MGAPLAPPPWSAVGHLLNAGAMAYVLLFALAVCESFSFSPCATLRRALARDATWKDLAARYSFSLTLLRMVTSTGICVVYVCSTYLGRIGAMLHMMQAVVGIVLMGRFVTRLAIASRPLRFVLSLEAFVEALSLTSLVLAHEHVWLNFSFLQAVVVLIRYFELEPTLELMMQQKTSPVRRQLTRLTLEFIVFIYVFASGLQLFELLGDPTENLTATTFELTLANSLYFTVVTIFTVGYGDFVPYTLLGRLWIIFIIVFGAYLVSRKVSQVMDVMSGLRRGMGSFVKAEGVEHVVVCGNVKWEYLKTFVQEFYGDARDERNKGTKVVVICDKLNWTEEVWNKFFTSRATYKNDVVFLEGSCVTRDDLVRAQVETALSVFVLNNQHNPDPYAEDSETLKRILTIRSFSPNLPIYSMCALRDSMLQITYALEHLGHSGNTAAMSGSGAGGGGGSGRYGSEIGSGGIGAVLSNHNHSFTGPPSDVFGGGYSRNEPPPSSYYTHDFSDDDMDDDGLHVPHYDGSSDLKSEAICMQEVEMCLLAENIFCNGLSTLLANLVLHVQPQTKPEEDRPWMIEYKIGAECRFEYVKLPMHLHGKRFADIALILYDYGILLMATKRFMDKKWRSITPDTVIHLNTVGLIVTFHSAQFMDRVMAHVALRVRELDEDITSQGSSQGVPSFDDDDDVGLRRELSSSRYGLAGDLLTGDVPVAFEYSGDELVTQPPRRFGHAHAPPSQALYAAAPWKEASERPGQPGGAASAPLHAQDLRPSASALPSTANQSLFVQAPTLQSVGASTAAVYSKDSKPSRGQTAGRSSLSSDASGENSSGDEDILRPVPLDQSNVLLDMDLDVEGPEPTLEDESSTDGPESEHPSGSFFQYTSQSAAEEAAAADSSPAADQEDEREQIALRSDEQQLQPAESRTPPSGSESVLPRRPPPLLPAMLQQSSDDKGKDDDEGVSRGERLLSSLHREEPGSRRARMREQHPHVSFPNPAPRRPRPGATDTARQNNQGSKAPQIYFGDAALPVHLKGHIVVCVIGQMALMNLKHFLNRVWMRRRGTKRETPVVAICPRLTDDDERDLGEFGSDRLFLIQGNSLSVRTLKRAQFDTARAIVVLACEDKNDVDHMDAKAIFTVMTLDYLLGEQSNTFVCSMLDAEESMQLLRAPAHPRRRGVNLGLAGEDCLWFGRPPGSGGMSRRSLSGYITSQSATYRTFHGARSPLPASSILNDSGGAGGFGAERMYSFGAQSIGSGLDNLRQSPSFIGFRSQRWTDRSEAIGRIVEEGEESEDAGQYATRGISSNSFGAYAHGIPEDDEDGLTNEPSMGAASLNFLLNASTGTMGGAVIAGGQEGEDGAQDARGLGRTNTRQGRDELFERQRYASGEMMISSMYMALLIREYAMPGMMTVVRKIFGAGVGKNARSKNCWIRTVKIPRQWIMSAPDGRRVYRELFETLLELGAVPLGLYRSGEIMVRVQVDEDAEMATPANVNNGSHSASSEDSNRVFSSGSGSRDGDGDATPTGAAAAASSSGAAAGSGRQQQRERLFEFGGDSIPSDVLRGGNNIISASSVPPSSPPDVQRLASPPASSSPTGERQNGETAGARVPLPPNLFLDVAEDLHAAMQDEGMPLPEVPSLQSYTCPSSGRTAVFEEVPGGDNVLPYVYTNPEAYTLVSEHDAVYVLAHPHVKIPSEW